MSNSEQLERQAEQCRARIEDSLDELRGRLTPGEIVDRLVDYARHSGGGQFVRNLQQQVIDNPLPLTLVGAGLAWLMMGTSRGTNGRARHVLSQAADMARRSGEYLSERAGDATRAVQTTVTDFADTTQAAAGRSDDLTRRGSEDASDRMDHAGQPAQTMASSFADTTRQRAHDWSETAQATGSAAYDQIRDTTAQVRNVAGSTSGSMRDAASSAYGGAADRASRTAARLRSSSASLRDSASETGHGIVEALRSQPMVLAGIGLALGAAIGAVLPGSVAEDRIMGEASDDVKATAQNAAGEQVDKAKAAAEHVYEGAVHPTGQQDVDSTQGSAEHTAEAAHVETEAPALVPSHEDDSTGREEIDLATTEQGRS